jgi:hypothetical protein
MSIAVDIPYKEMPIVGCHCCDVGRKTKTVFLLVVVVSKTVFFFGKNEAVVVSQA